MLNGPPRRRRARPVADAPIDELLAGADELAKGWLLALLEQAPLEAAAGILAADLARDGPRICDAIVRALASDDDLGRIEPGGALERLVSRAGELGGGEDPAAVNRTVDALHAVIWSALRAELRAPEPEQAFDLAERLALVIERVRAATLRRGELGGRPMTEVPPRPEPVVTSSVRVSRLEAAPVRAEPLWVGALEDELRHSQRSGAPLSLVLAELDDGERVQAVETRPVADVAFGHFAQAIRSAVRREDILACESETKAWVIARETSRDGARALAERIAVAVERAPEWRGAPMTASVGLAVFGEDGRDAEGLIEAAEEARFAAMARGVRVMPDVPGGDAPSAD